MPGLDDASDHGKDVGVEDVADARDRPVQPIDGEQVLDEVVRADRQEVGVSGQPAHAERGRRHLDHHADLDLVGVDTFLRAGRPERFEGRHELDFRRHERKHDRETTRVLARHLRTRTEQRPELIVEEVSSVQAQPDPA